MAAAAYGKMLQMPTAAATPASAATGRSRSSTPTPIYFSRSELSIRCILPFIWHIFWLCWDWKPNIGDEKLEQSGNTTECSHHVQANYSHAKIDGHTRYFQDVKFLLASSLLAQLIIVYLYGQSNESTQTDTQKIIRWWNSLQIFHCQLPWEAELQPSSSKFMILDPKP
jgi:hypothetical protein